MLDYNNCSIPIDLILLINSIKEGKVDMRVCTSVEVTWLPGDYSDDVESVEAICSRCQYSTASFGTSQASERRSLVLLRRGCPLGESNYYQAC